MNEYSKKRKVIKDIVERPDSMERECTFKPDLTLTKYRNQTLSSKRDGSPPGECSPQTRTKINTEAETMSNQFSQPKAADFEEFYRRQIEHNKKHMEKVKKQ